MDNRNFHSHFEQLKLLAFTVTQIALKSLQESRNNCLKKHEHTIIQNSLDSMVTLLRKFVIFQPKPQNSLLLYLGAQHFVPSILLDLPTTDSTFSTLSRHRMAGIQYLLPMLLHSTRQMEKQVVWRAKSLQHRPHS